MLSRKRLPNLATDPTTAKPKLAAPVHRSVALLSERDLTNAVCKAPKKEKGSLAEKLIAFLRQRGAGDARIRAAMRRAGLSEQQIRSLTR